VDEVFIPDSIQDVIMARIDRLEEVPKKTLQLASVIGREFTRRLLEPGVSGRDGRARERRDHLGNDRVGIAHAHGLERDLLAGTVRPSWPVLYARRVPRPKD
jgi:hypothetical protein